MSKPEKGTPEYDLWICAIEVAIHAPWTQNQFTVAAKIPWQDINALRTALEKVGIDWRPAKETEDTRLKEAAGRSQAKREARQREENDRADEARRG